MESPTFQCLHNSTLILLDFALSFQRHFSWSLRPSPRIWVEIFMTLHFFVASLHPSGPWLQQCLTVGMAVFQGIFPQFFLNELDSFGLSSQSKISQSCLPFCTFKYFKGDVCSILAMLSCQAMFHSVMWQSTYHLSMGNPGMNKAAVTHICFSHYLHLQRDWYSLRITKQIQVQTLIDYIRLYFYTVSNHYKQQGQPASG